MDTDPRKKYAMKHKEHCDKLPDYIKIHIPRCNKEIKDIVIPHKPRPLPPGPGPQPPFPPPPPWWTAPLDVPYREPAPDYTAAYVATGLGGALAARGLDRRINERRARAPRGRIAPEEGERGEPRRRRLRARVGPEEREPLRAEIAPPELEDTGAGVFGPSEADSRLAGGVQSALEAGDRAEEAARTVPLTGDGVGGALDARNLPRANPPETRPAPRPQRMVRADPRLEEEFGGPDIDDPDFEMPDIPDDHGDADPRRLRIMRSGQSMLPRAFQPEARVSTRAPRGAMRPQVGGQSARTGVSDINPSVRPEPKRQTLTKRRKLKFRAEQEEFAPTEHPSEIQAGGGSEAGPSGVKPDPMEQIVEGDELRAQEQPRVGKGKGRAYPSRSTYDTRREGVSTRTQDTLRGRKTARALQAEREGGAGGPPERTSFRTAADHQPVSSTDDMLDEIERMQNTRSRGSIRGPTDDPAEVVRGRGLGEPGTFEEPTEVSPDQGLGDVPDDFEPMEDVPLLSTPSEPGRPPRITNISRIKRALGGIKPMDRLAELAKKVNSLGVPQLQTTQTTQPTQAAKELQEARAQLAEGDEDITKTRNTIQQAKANMATERATISSETPLVQQDETALGNVDKMDDEEIGKIDQAISQVDMMEDGGFMAQYGENLDGGIGLTEQVAARLGLFGEKLAASTAVRATGKVVGGALRIAGAPIRMVQAVGDVAGGVLKQGALKVGERVGGEVGARIALGAARATGLVASGVGLISGGGELDPVQDAVGAALLLAVPLQMLGTYLRHQAEGQTEYGGIKGATNAGPNTDLWLHFNQAGQKSIKKLMKGVPMDARNSKGKLDWWKPSTIKAHSQDAYEENEMLSDYNMAAINYAHHNGNEPVYYNDKSTGKSGFVVPLNDQQLKNAMAVYQKNPNAFAQFDPMQLEIMGLNPSMANGAAGATKIGNIYVPSFVATGKKTTGSLNSVYTSAVGSDGKMGNTIANNYSNAFLAWHKLDKMPQGQTNYFTSTSPPTIDPQTYISDMTTVINGMATGSKAQQYLSNQLAWYRYYNVPGTKKPETKLSPPTDAAEQQKLQDAQNDLTTAQNQLNFNITLIGNEQEVISQDQTAVAKLQTKINQLQGQPQTTTTTASTQQQLQNYEAQANNYNLRVAQQVEQTEQQLQASTGLTAQDYQGLNKVLKQQITGTGITTYTQNQLANLPRATPQQTTSSQGPTAPTTSSGQGATGTTTTSGQGTGVNTRATTSPSGNNGNQGNNPASGAVNVPSSSSGQSTPPS